MKILLLSCSTGEGHNHCALAVKEALDARGHETSFLDMLHMFGDPGPLSFDKILNRISTKAPDVFGVMYHAGAMYSANGVTSPVYMANIRHARQLNAFIRDNGYDAVVCSHLFPMETLTFLRRWERCDVKCYGILSDYTCIPFLTETCRTVRCGSCVFRPGCRPKGSSCPACRWRRAFSRRWTRPPRAQRWGCRRTRGSISS